MGYEFDIFVSYKRYESWNGWLTNMFLPVLDAFLFEELGRKPKIFVDEQIRTGNSWPSELGEKLATSKIILPIITKPYLCSHWCMNELDLFYDRAIGINFKNGGSGLIIPVLAQDGDEVPQKIGNFQRFDVRTWRNPYLVRDSDDHFALSKRIRSLAIELKQVLEEVPTHEPAWTKICIDRMEAIRTLPNGQLYTPKNFPLSNPTDVNVVPRLKA